MSENVTTIKMPPMTRGEAARVESIDEATRTVRFSFASAYEVMRDYGIERLRMTPDAADLSRIARGTAHRVNHRQGELVGVTSAPEIKDGRAFVTVRFGESEYAQEIFRDVVTGIRPNVSFMYFPKRLRELEVDPSEEPGKDDMVMSWFGPIPAKESGKLRRFEVTRWEAIETATVDIPADPSVGVGRDWPGIEARDVEVEWLDKPADDPRPVPVAEEARAQERKPMSTTAVPGAPELETVRVEATKKAEARIKEIWAIGREAEKRGVKDASKAAEAAIDNDATAEEFRRTMFAAIPAAAPMAVSPESDRKHGAFLDLSSVDLGRYRLSRLLLALADGDWSKAGFERECSVACAEAMGVQARGAIMPNDILSDPRFSRYHGAGIPISQRTTLITSSGTNALLGTEQLGGSFIELLRNRSVVLQAGAMVLDGLVGNIDIPRQTGGGAFEWVAEDAGPTADADPVFGKVNAAPNTATSRQPLSRRLLLQGNPSAEALVRDDLLAIIATGVDTAMLRGTGGVQPQGVVGSSGVGSVAHGTNGGPPTWATVVEFETDVADANADVGSLAYIASPKVRGKLKTVDKGTISAGTYLMADDGTVNGYRFFATKNLLDTLTKGASVSILSHMIFGNWRDLILCMWGALDFVMDTATDINKGGLILRVFQDVDVVIRHGGSFSVTVDLNAN